MSSHAPAYPPRSDKPDEIERALEALARQYGARKLIYLSTPITTGQRYYDFVRGVGRDLPPDKRKHLSRKHVLEPNMAAARVVRERLAAQLNEPVIDPTAVDYKDWGQEDYKVLWASVIERSARAVAFVDGWEYSNGCAFEFLTAVRTVKDLMDEHLQPLAPASGVKLVESAIPEIMHLGEDATFLKCVLRDLRSVVNADHSN
jgi:hypothetical protein